MAVSGQHMAFMMEIKVGLEGIAILTSSILNPFHVLSCRRARFKWHQEKVPVKENLPALKERAMQAVRFRRHIETVIPSESWTPQVEK